MLIDTHCHLTHERFAGDLREVLLRAGEVGVGEIVAIASELDEVPRLLGLEQRREETADSHERVPRVRFTAGVHPHHAGAADRDLRVRLADVLDAHPQVVAIGECGLDHHYDFAPRDAQRDVFRLQLETAADRGLPVVVHCREAETEMAPMVREAGRAGVRGVVHCFPGDLDLLEAAMEADWHVSFTGLVTFRSFAGDAAVRAVPHDRYMLETDGPYMAPVPHRGKRNEPAFVPWIRDRVAELRDESPEDVERATTDTARRFFALPDLP